VRKISEFDAITSSRSNVCFMLKSFAGAELRGRLRASAVRAKLKFCHHALKVERPLPPP